MATPAGERRKGQTVKRDRRWCRGYLDLILNILLWAVGQALICLLLPLITRACEPRRTRPTQPDQWYSARYVQVTLHGGRFHRPAYSSNVSPSWLTGGAVTIHSLVATPAKSGDHG